MGNIKLARVDDRLIHGQVMTSWLQHTSAKQIVIIDDETAKDDFTSRVMKLTVPKHVNLIIMTIGEAKNALINDISKPTILLAKYPKVYLELIEYGVDISQVQIGGMGSTMDRSPLYKNIYASPEEREDMQKIIDTDTPIILQMVSSDNPVKLTNELIEK